LFKSFNPPIPAPAPAAEEKKEAALKEEASFASASVVEEKKVTSPKEESAARVVEQKKEQVKSEPAVNTHKGKVNWFHSKQGYGFIAPDDSDEAIFVHQTAIQCTGFRTLKVEEKVEFQIEVDEQGRTKAVHVTGPDGGPLLGELRKSKIQNDNEETS
jgi:cold shock CspA family protein